mgnify:CR=1 FL=1
MERPEVGELAPPDRLLMGPGPSEVHPRVLRAMSTPLVGHLDPAFLDIMDEVQDLLRYTFRTDNRWTIPVSGTGSASMEAAVGNLTEPGDRVLVPGNGYFGERMAAMVRRAGGSVVTVDAPWGEPLDPADVAEAFDAHQPDLFGFVHAETSTGALQPDVPELTDIAHDHDALVIADVVTSLGGVELRVDETLRNRHAAEMSLRAASEEDWATEYLDSVLSVRTVSGLEDAIDHINTYGNHSDAIVTESYRESEEFLDRVDSAAVYVNASTRFTDGYEFGLGAEIGISTDRLHCRGPMGLRELTIPKYVVHGQGQVRN